MSKEKFSAGELTYEDMLIIDSALCLYYNEHTEEKVLLVKRKVEWLLYYVNWKTFKPKEEK